MNFFSIHNIAITLMGYEMSWIELLATLFTVACVWLAMKKHILNWPVALIAIVLSYALFYQNELYADSFLQIYFFVASAYGWWYWSRPNAMTDELPVTQLTNQERINWLVILMLAWVAATYFTTHLNIWWPQFYPKPAAFPIADSFILVASFLGQWLLAKKKLENWICWIIVNCTAVFVYYLKDLKLFSILYLVLLFIAIQGVITWNKKDEALKN